MNTDEFRMTISRMVRGSFSDLLANIQKEYDAVCKDRDELSKTLREWNKDAELQKLRAEVDFHRTHGLHRMSDKELGAMKAFRQKHYEKCKNGGKYRFELTGTGIGEAISISCPVCGEQEDITDYSDW